MQPVPIGVSGEVLIGGAGPALGYLNNQALTSEKFITNPCPSKEYLNHGWTIAYCSGDRGRLREDGALLFDGRIEGDTQIKLRGLRIELGDIERAIVVASNGIVREAIVSARGDPEFLVAHVVTESPDSNINSFLSKLINQLPLPQYMRPAFIIRIERMPLTLHLKVDRRAIATLPLKLPGSTDSGAETDPGDSTDTESQLREIWKRNISREVAESCGIAKDTDIFHVGGNSMLLPKLQVEIRTLFDTVLPLHTFFVFSTLERMATKIEETAVTSTIE
jgi:hybrid polyketide synthase/nonribosomal peptide synthetase ACE1